jgi:hypothetical protein
VFHKLTIVLTSGQTAVLHHYNPSQPALVETDVSDIAIAAILSANIEAGKLHPVSWICRKLTTAEFNYYVFDKETIAVAFSFVKMELYSARSSA